MPKKTHILIILSILLTPVYTSEFLLLTSGQGSDRGVILSATPLFIKLIKDFLLIIINLTLVKNFIRQFRRHKLLYLIFFLLPSIYIIILAYTSMMNQNSYLLSLAGFRWAYPLLMTFFLIGTVNGKILSRVSIITCILFEISFVLQLYQLQFSKVWFSGLLGGRPGGLFLTPSTSGLFACSVFFLSCYFLKKSIFRTVNLILIPFSILISASGGSIASYLFVSFMVGAQYFFGEEFKSYQKVIVLIIISIASFSGISLITLISGRNDIFEGSALIRLNIFSDLFESSNMISSSFGKYTNSGYLLSEKLGLSIDSEIVDSTYSCILGNLGIFGFLMFILILCLWLYSVFLSSEYSIFTFSGVYLIHAATASLTESFPVSLIFTMLLSYYLNIFWTSHENFSLKAEI